MCMQPTQVASIQKWPWAGNEIVHNTIIPASRTVPGTRKKYYDIDIREYLSTEDNAVVRATLKKIVSELPTDKQAFFSSAAAGAFDYRADVIVSYLANNIRYAPIGRRFDEWQFPDETLAIAEGDCEDVAFLLAALLEASGISGYCIRVVLGCVSHQTHDGRTNTTDHAWVVYLNEQGAWELLEPLAIVGKKHKHRPELTVPHELDQVEYTPYFVFNRTHLWRIRSAARVAALPLNDYLASRQFWEGYHPLFAVKVHEGIYDEALKGISDDDLRTVKRASLIVDANVLAYDPRDHCDFAYVDEAWARIQQRVATGKLWDFAYAIHAVADFYAHTLYGEFGPKDADGNLVLFDPAHPSFESPTYDFSAYQPLPGCNETIDQAAADWKGKLISGQWWRWYSTFPDELENSAGFAHRRCLPDHDTIAVDSPTAKSTQIRYKGDVYATQFRLRRTAAVRHVAQMYQGWTKK